MPQAAMKFSVSEIRCARLAILFAGRAIRDEAQHPAMDIVQIGIAALGEGAQQIQRRGRLG